MCIAVAAITAAWYATEGWPVVNRWSHQRLLPRPATPANDLPTLVLAIDAGAYRALKAQRASAIERGIWIPEEAEWQPVQIQLAQQTLSGRVRLGGTGADHWQAAKWSLQVEVEGDAAVLGMHALTLRSPATCGYLNGWLYAQAVRRAGIVAPQYAFANVSVNGQDWGIYAAVERVSAQSLDTQGRGPGATVRFDGSPLDGGPDLPLSAEIELPDSSGTVADPQASAEVAAAEALVRGLQEGRLTPGQAFDPGQTGRYLAQADLWGVDLGASDERYYYSGKTGKLEPIAAYGSLLASTEFVPAAPAAYDDPAIAEAYVQEALRIAQPAHLDALRQAYAPQFERYYAALAQEFFPAYLEPPWQALSERQARLRAALYPAQTVQAYRVGAQQDGAIELQVANLLPYPVTLLRLHLGQQELAFEPDWVAEADRTMLHEASGPGIMLKGMRETVPHYVTMRVPLVIPGASGLGDLPDLDPLQVTTRIAGVPDEVLVDVQKDPRPDWTASVLPVQPTVEETLRQHPFLAAGEQPGYLAIAPGGTWHVDGDLILPSGLGLWATGPVTLTFDRQAILFASGPLRLQGNAQDRLYLVPHDKEWGGLVVYRADGTVPSSLDHVEVRGTTGLSHDGWRLPAGVTFYGSPVVLRHCRILDSAAPAAFYVADATFVLTDTELGQGLHDGFRGNLARGQMARCAFHDLLGNGVSLFRSNLIVRDTTLLRIYGQGVSAAAGSEVTAQGMRCRDTGTAFASADSSVVDLQGAHVAQAWRAALAAYLEKQRYGPSSIRASQIAFEDDSTHAWLQSGNQIAIEGAPVPPGEPEASAPSRHYELGSTAYVEHARFGSALRLVAYDLPVEQATPGESLPLTLYWQASAKLGRDYTVFVHLLDATGEIAAQWDAMPRENTFVTTAWPVGEIIDDPHPVPLPEGIPPGEYRIALGVYDRPTSDRLPAYGPDGEPAADAAVLLGRVVEVR
ncbi:MAG: CotH kinase family protein [Anaerolineae bacterium]